MCVCVCHVPICEIHPSHIIYCGEKPFSWTVSEVRFFNPLVDHINVDLVDRLATKNVDSALPDSITEWGVLAISASPDTGQRGYSPSRKVLLRSSSASLNGCRVLCGRAVQREGVEAFLCGPEIAIFGGQKRAGGDQSRDP